MTKLRMQSRAISDAPSASSSRQAAECVCNQWSSAVAHHQRRRRDRLLSAYAISGHQQWRTISVVVETGCIWRVSMRRTPSAVTNGTQIKRPYSSYSLGDAIVQVDESQWQSEENRRPSEGNQTPSEAIGGQSDATDAIRRTQRPSEAIGGHHRSSGRSKLTRRPMLPHSQVRLGAR